jgi:hypothetical protein
MDPKDRLPITRGRRVAVRAAEIAVLATLAACGSGSSGPYAQATGSSETTSGPTAPSTSPPPSNASTIDWKNTTYTTGCGGMTSGSIVTVPMRGGKGSATVIPSGEPAQRLEIAVETVQSGRLTGLGTATAVILACRWAGGSGSQQELQLFGPDDKLLQADHLPDLTLAAFDTTALAFEGGSLLTGAGYWAKDECSACGPSIYKVLRWKWDAAARSFRGKVDRNAARPAASAPRSHDLWTQIDFTVADCADCVITAGTIDSSGAGRTWASRPVKAGRTFLILPKDSTHKMAFAVGRPSRNNITADGAVPVIVLGYKSQPAGSTVSAKTSAAQKSANSCWSGTNRSDIPINVEHRTYALPPGTGPDNHVDTFWASPTVPVASGYATPTSDGGMGFQDDPGCYTQ